MKAYELKWLIAVASLFVCTACCGDSSFKAVEQRIAQDTLILSVDSVRIFGNAKDYLQVVPGKYRLARDDR